MTSEPITRSINGWIPKSLQDQATDFIQNFKQKRKYRYYESFNWTCFGNKEKVERLSKITAEYGAAVVKEKEFLLQVQEFTDFLNYDKCQGSIGSKWRVLLISDQAEFLAKKMHKCKCGIPIAGQSALSYRVNECLQTLV